MAGVLAGRRPDGHHGVSSPCSEVPASSTHSGVLRAGGTWDCQQRTPLARDLASAHTSRHLVLCLCQALGINSSPHLHSCLKCL